MPLPPLPTRLGATVRPAAEADDTDVKTQAPVTAKPAPQSAPAGATAVKPASAQKTAPTQTTAKTATKTAVKSAAKTATKTAAKTATTTTAATKTADTRRNTADAGAATAKPATAAAARRRTRLPVSRRKLFVLDTNVLLHDSSCLFKFAEHDIFLPMVVLEELDQHKKGMSEVARNARQVSRYLDGLISDTAAMSEGTALDILGHTDALGTLHIQTGAMDAKLPIALPQAKADNAILGVVHALQAAHPKREIILVSKDINMRLKARALGLSADDYLNDHVVDDSDLLYEGVQPLPDNFWLKHGKHIESWQQGGTTFYRIQGPMCADFIVNEFVYLEGDMPLQAQVREVHGKTAVLTTLRDYSHGKHAVWGVTARNREQNFALNLLMNPDCDFVSLLGQAGTGKTLLALAAGLAQTMDTRRYSEIIITRATVPLGDDIGFLPGTEEEKMAPWMGALEDNLEVLQLGQNETSHSAEGARQATLEAIRSRIKIKSLNFMRGRTFLNKYLIIDEAQNLTPKQMKALVTRAGPGTKIICLGNIAQIDTPYLTEGSSGLTYVVDRFKGWPHAGHITLQRGERSRLADYASEAL